MNRVVVIFFILCQIINATPQQLKNAINDLSDKEEDMLDKLKEINKAIARDTAMKSLNGKILDMTDHELKRLKHLENIQGTVDVEGEVK